MSEGDWVPQVYLQDTAATIIVRLDLASSIYSRCDAKGCDDRDARQSAGGMFTIVNATDVGVQGAQRWL